MDLFVFGECAQFESNLVCHHFKVDVANKNCSPSSVQPKIMIRMIGNVHPVYTSV